MRLATEIEATGSFRLISRGDQVPAFAFTTTSEIKTFDVYDVSRRLRERGWLVPAYPFPAHRTDLNVLRIVVRNGFTEDLADLLLDDLRRLVPELHAQPAPASSGAGSAGFHH